MATVSKLQIVLEATTTAFDRGLKSATHQLDGFAKQVGTMHDRMDKFVRQNKRTFATMQSIGQVSAVALVGVGAGIKSVTDEAVKFESAMAGVRKVIDFESPAQFKQMEQDIIALSQRLPMAANDIAAIMEAAGQSGIARDELARFAESAVKMGVAFDITAEQAGKAMAEMRASFGMTQTQVETLADQINYLGNNSTNSAPQIMEVVQRIGSLADVANISSSTLAALSASMVGVAPEVAATSLKNFTLALSKGESLSKSAQKAFTAMGIDYKQVAKDMQTDSEATIRKVLEAVQQVPEHLRVSMLTTAFGSESVAAISQLVTNYEAVDKNLKAMGDSAVYAGSMLKEFEGMAGTSQAQMQLFDNNLTAVKIALGQALLPALNDIVQSLTPFLQQLTQWASQNPELVSQITIATTVILGLGVAIGAIGVVIPAIISGFGVLASPIALASLAIGALIAAGVLLYKNWDKIKAKAQEVFNGLPEPVKAAVEMIKGWLGLLLTLWQTQFNAIKTVVTLAMNSIKAVISAGVSIFTSVFNAGFNLIKNAFTTAFNVIKALVRGDMDGVKQAISTGMKNAYGIIKQLVGDIMGAFRQLGVQLLQAGRDAIQGFINGIKDKMTQALNTARDMANSVANVVKSALNIRSPSRVMAELGEWTALGLAKGIADKTPVVGKAAANLADQIKQNVAGKLAELKRELALFGNNNPLTELSYDIGLGKYGNNTKQLVELATKLYSQQQNQAVLDDIRQISQAMTTHGMSRRQQLEWEIANTNKYKGVLAETLDEYKNILDTQEQFNALLTKQNTIQQANKELVQSTADLQKQLALFGNQSKLADFDYDVLSGKYDNADVQNILAYRKALQDIESLQAKNDARQAFDRLSTEFGEHSALDKLQHTLDERLRIISKYEQTHTDIAEQANILRMRAQESFDRARTDLMINTYESGFGAVGSIIKSAFGEQSKAYRAIFALEKGMALSRIWLDNKVALAKAWASAPFPRNLPIVAKVAIETGALASAVNAINPIIGQAHDGIMSVPKSGTWNLEKGERVLPKHTAQNLDNTLANLQGKRQGETKVIINNYTGEKTDVQQMPNGDMMVSIGKMMKQVGRAEAQQVVREELSQGGSISRRLK